MSATNGMVMPTSIGGCIGSIVSTALKLGALVRDITNAPAHIQRICAKAESCRTMVLSLRILLMKMEKEGGDQVGLELIYVSNLANTLVCCQEVLGLIEKQLEDLMKENMKIGKDERARWIWREKEIEELLKQLDEYKLELILNLNILNCHQGQEIRGQNAEITKQNAEITKQNAEILNSIYNSHRSTSIELVPPIRPGRRLLSMPNENKQPSLSLSAISEHEEVETLEVLQNNPEKNTNYPSTSTLSTETNTPSTNTPSVNPPFADRGYPASTSTYSITVSGLTLTEASSFQEILFASRVYQQRSLKRRVQVLPSDITLSELHHSSASILSYSLRRTSSLSAPLAILTAGAPLSILSKNPSQKDLDAAFAGAVKKQNLKAMCRLLEYGADVNGSQRFAFRFQHQMEKGNLLHIACSNRLQTLAPNSLVVRFLLDHGADPSALIERTGTAPVHIAIGEGNIELAQLLLSYGADVNIQTHEGNTAFHMATRHAVSGCRILQLLLDHGAAIDAVNHIGETALLISVRSWTVETANFLIEAGADVNIQNKKGETPLHYAVSGAILPEVLKLLLDSGADTRKKNKHGKTALHLACERRQQNLIKMLLEHTVDRDVDVVDDNGETPLMKATSTSALESVSLLLKAGADARKRNNLGKTALHFATFKLLEPWMYLNPHGEFIKITRLLLEHGADIDAEDENGDTPLIYTIRDGQDALAQLLLKAGANARKANKQCMTPFRFAQLHPWSSSHLVRILREYGIQE